MNQKNKKIGVVGFGKMASAIIGGSDYKDIYIYDKNEEVLKKYINIYNICDSISELLDNVDIVLLSVKPFVFDDVISEIKNSYKNQLVMSILAGVKIEKYLKYVPDMKIIRIMPNTPALVSMGMSAICPSKNVSDDDIDFAIDFMKSVGEVVVEKEENMDIITALSGSGPAYYYKIIELFAKGAQKLGLDYKKALLLSAQTALGSAKMVIENNFDINQLITNVTTKGGCTEVGNKVISDSDMDKIIDKTIFDTMEKARRLG